MKTYSINQINHKMARLIKNAEFEKSRIKIHPIESTIVTKQINFSNDVYISKTYFNNHLHSLYISYKGYDTMFAQSLNDNNRYYKV